MSDQAQPRFMIDPYLEWLKGEGIPVTEDFWLDLFAVPTAPWARFDCKGGAAHVKGRGDYACQFVLDIAPSKSTSPQRHLYEEVVYILEGQGSTQLEFGNGEKRSFEWGPHSLFAIPPNVKYRHFNGSGRNRALMASTTNLPVILNLFINPRFVFENDFDFIERIGKTGYYAGEGDATLHKKAWIWETNFVPDLATKELQTLSIRGKGATGYIFQLADGVMHAHLSEIPVGRYKKAHRHPAGTHVMIVKGTGFSLMWYDLDKDLIRIEWKHGIVFPPAEAQFHQHFNTSLEPARYLATRVGSQRYPFTQARKRSSGGLGEGQAATGTLSVKLGGDQIEYEDQDPRIHKWYTEAMKKHGLEPNKDMDELFVKA